MDLLNLIIWMSAGAVVGWFARGMVRLEHRRVRNPTSSENRSEKKG